MRNEFWMAEAACANVGGDPWFPETGESTTPARKICRQRTVRAECLAFAERENLFHGVWGGLTPTDRRRLRKQAAA